jgi:hypothetical protein
VRSKAIRIAGRRIKSARNDPAGTGELNLWIRPLDIPHAGTLATLRVGCGFLAITVSMIEPTGPPKPVMRTR